MRALTAAARCDAELLSSADYKAVRERLPLLWFDRALRAYGPLLPLPVLALRLASIWAGLPSSEQQQACLPTLPVAVLVVQSLHACSASRSPAGYAGLVIVPSSENFDFDADVGLRAALRQGLAALQRGRLAQQLKEAGVVYTGIALLRLVVYWTHCAGVYPCRPLACLPGVDTSARDLTSRRLRQFIVPHTTALYCQDAERYRILLGCSCCMPRLCCCVSTSMPRLSSSLLHARAGVYLLLSRAGMISAAPLQLMSDHVFLGASLAAVVAAEAVLCRTQLRACRGAGAPRLLLLTGAHARSPVCRCQARLLHMAS